MEKNRTLVNQLATEYRMAISEIKHKTLAEYGNIEWQSSFSHQLTRGIYLFLANGEAKTIEVYRSGNGSINDIHGNNWTLACSAGLLTGQRASGAGSYMILRLL